MGRSICLHRFVLHFLNHMIEQADERRKYFGRPRATKTWLCFTLGRDTHNRKSRSRLLQMTVMSTDSTKELRKDRIETDEDYCHSLGRLRSTGLGDHLIPSQFAGLSCPRIRAVGEMQMGQTSTMFQLVVILITKKSPPFECHRCN
jgi:hypothetical protein